MTENFEQLFEESLSQLKMTSGAIVKATVVAIGNETVTVNAGLKSEGIIPLFEFKDEHGECEVVIGDEVEVALDTVENGFGETVLSRERAKRLETWRRLEEAHEANSTVMGVITDKVKGGFTVTINNVRAFLPGSLVDVRPVRDTSYLEGKELEFKVIKMDAKRNNIVVSRRAVVQSSSVQERDALLESLNEGQQIKGVVKNLTDYGAFIDLGGIDGLLHITDISWKRVKHPSEVLTVGDEVNVKVLKFDRERNRVSLGMKQLGEDPWSDLADRFPENTVLNGKVTNITDYGCFVEIEEGVEGLVHMSEMDWTNKNIHPSKVVSLGDEVTVKVLEIDRERRRISLGMKQCADNPWDTFAKEHGKGEKITGNIKSITDFGIFIGLEGEIDGLIHLSDISWNVPGEEAVRNFKKGDEVTALILGIDPDRERISLGIKQLESDPFGAFCELNPKGSPVKGKVTEVDAKGAVIELGEEVEGYLKANEISAEKIDDASKVLKVGDDVDAVVLNVDKKNRSVSLSIKARDRKDEAEALSEYRKSASDSESGATLGDILKEKIGSTEEK
jgi:small subunit ribosomal protein S1